MFRSNTNRARGDINRGSNRITSGGRRVPIRPEFAEILYDGGLGILYQRSKGLSRRRPYSAVGGRCGILPDGIFAVCPTRTEPLLLHEEGLR